MITSIEFFTATGLNWQPLLNDDTRKEIIVDSLRFLVSDGRVWVFGFVIMPNHIHILWAKRPEWKDKSVQQHFLKFTAQSLKFHLLDNNLQEELNNYRSTQADRQYHIWERRPWQAFVPNKEVFLQKLNYIHNNPVKSGLCIQPENYLYSSAGYYISDDNNGVFFLTL